ncbi:MAG TPA: DNA recombination protein RmuC [Candidatus Dormibacteraeota bacterium]|nr:DNA recombination protein RmuC [Candidatus Dormibacteraeota bacterium]
MTEVAKESFRMTQLLVGILLVAVILLAMGVIWLATRRRTSADGDFAALRHDMQTALSSHSQSVNTQLGQVLQTVLQQLGQVTTSLQDGLSSSGQLVSQAQAAVASELRNSQEVLGRVGKQLGEIQQAGRELSQATQTLQSVLGGAKTRGSLGEVALEALLADALPRSAYETQYRFSTGAIVDAIIRTGEKIIAIDSKFPLETYRRMADSPEDARKEFFQAVRKHAESVAEKYILQNEGTLDVALMFVPSEGVYYELLMTSDAKLGRLDDHCRGKGILPVSPNTLHAYLSAILMGLKGMQVEENAKHLQAGLAGLQSQLDSFAKVYDTLGGHLRHAQQCYDEADRKLDRTRGHLEQMAQGSLPEAPLKALEPASRD